MLSIRKSKDRGFVDHGWLKSFHTFSFAEYYDLKHMSFSTLRVINEDFVAGGMGFGTHPHKDMEIITYVVSGALEHKDSMGNTAVILPDEVQHMSAGSGVEHSEFNHFKDQETHLLQIWILTEKKAISPQYGQKSFKEDFKNKNFVLVASKDHRQGSIGINQDADMYIGKLKSSQDLDFSIRPNRHVWVQMIKGEVDINGRKITAGDGLSASNEKALKIKSNKDSEFILFDLQ